MSHDERPRVKIIAFVGLAGAGVSTSVAYFTERGLPRVWFGGEIYTAMKEADVPRTAESERAFREAFRREHGKDVVAQRIIKQIKDLVAAGQHRVIADGLYSWSEYQALKHVFPGELAVIAVVAPRHTRYHRLEQRTKRPYTQPEAYARDRSEIEQLEKGGPIAIADHYVINDGSIEKLHEQLERLARAIEL